MKVEKLIDSFLSKTVGVIHIGASRGQERYIYDKYNLSVVWIEPIPEVFNILLKHIKPFPKQRALKYLITNIDDKKYKFRIANNRGESSSILDLKDCYKLWPNIFYIETIILKGITLTTLCQREQIDLSKYDALVLDTQGSELLVLQGAIPVLDSFKYIEVEVPNFESYKRRCQIGDIEKFMGEHGYKELIRRRQQTHHKTCQCYDIVYKKNE